MKRNFFIFLFIALVAFCAYAARFPTVTINDNGNYVIATIPRGGGLWKPTVRIKGDFGGGVVTLIYSDATNCTLNAATLKNRSGETYETSVNDVLSLELGIDKNDYTYLCAKLTGSTNPDIDIIVNDGR